MNNLKKITPFFLQLFLFLSKKQTGIVYLRMKLLQKVNTLLGIVGISHKPVQSILELQKSASSMVVGIYENLYNTLIPVFLKLSNREF